MGKDGLALPKCGGTTRGPRLGRKSLIGLGPAPLGEKLGRYGANITRGSEDYRVLGRTREEWVIPAQKKATWRGRKPKFFGGRQKKDIVVFPKTHRGGENKRRR